MIYKLEKWLKSEYGLDGYVAYEMASSICKKWKQSNEDTKIVKQDRFREIIIQEPEYAAMDFHPYENETRIVKKEVMAKEYRTFPFIAPYSKPKKTWIEVDVQCPAIVANDACMNTRTIKMEPLWYKDYRLTTYIDAGYDPMEDTLYINCEVSEC